MPLRVKLRVLVPLVLLAGLLPACLGADPWGLAADRIQAVVERNGDQLHPSLDGRALAWFDLEGDPNGACFVPSSCYEGECDSSCQGRIRVLDLTTGALLTLSEELSQETVPTLAGGRVGWFCPGDSGMGLCLSPADHRAVTFFPATGWDSNSYSSLAHRPLMNAEVIVWPEYNNQGNSWRMRLMQASLRSGEKEELLPLAVYPTEVVLADDFVAWVSSSWDGNSYRSTLEVLDLKSRASRVVTDTPHPVFGLGAHGDRLAWKQGTRQEWEAGDNPVHVFTWHPGGDVVQADSQDARVSEESRVVVGEERLLWLDYREGMYRVVERNLSTQQETLITPEEAVVGAYQAPALSGDRLVWSDLRKGNWDLYLLQR